MTDPDFRSKVHLVFAGSADDDAKSAHYSCRLAESEANDQLHYLMTGQEGDLPLVRSGSIVHINWSLVAAGWVTKWSPGRAYPSRMG